MEQDYDSFDEFDIQIQAGHSYAGIFTSLPFAKDEFQLQDMQATLQELYAASPYIRSVVDNHPDPVSFLSSRGHGRNRPNRVLEQPKSCV